MRFSADSADIPDDLLFARDLGDVVFFCGAGVSLARAGLPDFEGLLAGVIETLGAAQDSLVRNTGYPPDRRFRMLEHEFDTRDVRQAVAARLDLAEDADLSAHRVLLDLATSGRGVTRLVTTNFDHGFERIAPTLPWSGPPRLPDPHRDDDFQGVVHLHGRNPEGQAAPNLVLSSADFGRAYLADGWATRFIRRLLDRYQVVFVGYAAEDPPVQYLLEALDLPAGGRKKLYAFESAANGGAIGLWEQKGVEAIPYSGGYAALWETLNGWADRARDPEAWVLERLRTAAQGPETLASWQRGQIAHLVGAADGARRLVAANPPLPGSWLNVFDKTCRYATPEGSYHDPEAERFDPFSVYGLDSDPVPPRPDPENFFARREVPSEAWDGLTVSRTDRAEPVGQALAGEQVDQPPPLPPRLSALGVWIRNIAEQPAVLAWAARRGGLHPEIESGIDWRLRSQTDQFSPVMRAGWRGLFRATADHAPRADAVEYEIRAQVQADGWSPALVRTWAAMFTPHLTASASGSVGRDPVEPPEDLRHVLRLDVAYPRPHQTRAPPDPLIAYAVECFRANLNLAVALEMEVRGRADLYLTTSRAADGGLVAQDAFGVTGVLSAFQRLMLPLVVIDRDRARTEALSWPTDDYLFGRLRIWAAGLPDLLSPEEAAALFLDLSEQIFWGGVHQRDLLMALRDRWADLPEVSRRELEERILTGTLPYEGETDTDARRQYAAWDQLNRIEWLAGQGVGFLFDTDAEIARRRLVAPDWRPDAAAEAVEAHIGGMFSIDRDTDPAPLANLPLRDIFTVAADAGQSRIRDRVHRDPFAGMSAAHPARALAALSFAGRRDGAPLWAWADFLRSDARARDPQRLFLAIVHRLTRLPDAQLLAIADPVTEWMRDNTARLYAAPELEGPLWTAILGALRDDPSEKAPRRTTMGWADEGLNAPIGTLTRYALADPAREGRLAAQGLPDRLRTRLEALLALSGERVGQAVVMSAHQLTWLFPIDPEWTRAHLLPSMAEDSPTSEPFWEGFLWAGRPLGDPLLALMKPFLLRRAIVSDASGGLARILGGIILDGWGRGLAPSRSPEAITATEFREVLIHGDDDLRRDVLWTLSSWAREADRPWAARVGPFLSDVWPKQLVVKTPAMSARLADLVLHLPGQFAELVPIVVPRLMPLRRYVDQLDNLDEGDDGDLVVAQPAAVLDLLWALLGEDAESWPHGLADVIERLARQPAVQGDSRLSELRQRL